LVLFPTTTTTEETHMTTTTNRIRRIIQAASEYRTYVRAQAKASGSTCPIQVVPGTAAPHLTGSSFYFTTPGGKPVYYPSAYRKAFGRPVYNSSTRRIEVGAGWLAQRLIPAWCMTRAETAEELVRLGAVALSGESAVALGATPERALEILPMVGGWMPRACQACCQ
jgi:hypothetical protein